MYGVLEEVVLGATVLSVCCPPLVALVELNSILLAKVEGVESKGKNGCSYRGGF